MFMCNIFETVPFKPQPWFYSNSEQLNYINIYNILQTPLSKATSISALKSLSVNMLWYWFTRTQARNIIRPKIQLASIFLKYKNKYWVH